MVDYTCILITPVETGTVHVDTVYGTLSRSTCSETTDDTTASILRLTSGSRCSEKCVAVSRRTCQYLRKKISYIIIFQPS